ncbi:MAG: type II toxin-antitoxin system Phd/YefM family antitoxin [Kiritimatiellia bacterium]
MNATVVDLRYRMKEVLEALDRSESVNVLYHGKVKGVLSPVVKEGSAPVSSHPFFGMTQTDVSVETTMEQLREGRYRAV